MNLTSATAGPVTIVRLHGALDSEAAPPVQEELVRLIDGGASRLLVNLEGVSFVSSAGLRVLLPKLGQHASPCVDLVFEDAFFAAIDGDGTTLSIATPASARPSPSV